MKKILFITMISLAAFLMMGCKGEANSIDKAYLRGSWQIQNIDELVIYSFGDSIFYIDEKYEGTEFYYKVKENKIYYSESTQGIDIPSPTDSMEVRLHNDTLMVIVWFNPSIKLNETFLLKRMMK